ncbi:hypothetical protein QTP70_000829 [Hemibagrus guttatus]|uniref:Aminopeptidase N-like N-terminal domain-containing protein n=1 Tax=Hemibagrus guttatus TaxID=175788 RepID=A0AAE0QB39_9TELE|nr:hypothetical protein QTP70_000829 [Hemibagrus guttatus]
MDTKDNAAMGIEELSVRNGRAVSDRWADSVVVRPRPPERHVTVHKRLVLAFAVSILTLVVVTAIAVTLAISFEKCVSGSSENPVPHALRPRHYDLRLSVHMHNFTFSGDVSIELECVNATKFIVLHADRLHVEKVAVDSDSKKPGAMRIHRHFRYPHNQVYVIALHREMKPRRTYKIHLTFRGQIQNQLLGFFRTSYLLHGERRYAAVTQFSPTHARKAFPCFDEPVYKATFSVTLTHDASYRSVSNMPLESSSLDQDGRLTARLFSSHFLQLFRRDLEAFPGQPKDIVSPACPGSSPGPLPGGACPEHLSRETFRRHPKQMPEPPQLPPFNVEEQHLYSELLPGDRAPYPIPKGVPCHPTEEAHFGHLYPGSYPFSHDPELMTIGESRNVD